MRFGASHTSPSGGSAGVLPRLRSRRLRIAATVGALALALGTVATTGALAPQAAQAAPGTPGTPQAGSLIYSEDFQNAPTTGVTPITSYNPASGTAYSASALYQNPVKCNGSVFGHQATDAAFAAVNFCGGPGWWPSARTIPQAIGQYNGLADPSTNLAVAEQTGSTGDNYVGTMLEGSGIAMKAPGRFVTFSLNVGNLCNVGVQALDRFYLLNGANAIPLNSSDYNICADANRQRFTVDG